MKKWYLILLFLWSVFSVSLCYSNIVSGDGVADIKIGKALPKLEQKRIIFRHWQHDENSDKYELLRIKVLGGEVDVEVYDGLVYRLTINKPGIVTADGVFVGMKAAKVLIANRTIATEIGSGPSLFLVPINPCGMSYQTDFEFKNQKPENMTRASVISMLKRSKIKAILIVGCNK